MRPGPSTEALAGAMRVGARVHVVRGGLVLATDIPAWDVLLEYTAAKNKGDIPSQVTYMCPPEWAPQASTDPLACYGQRSLVTAVYRGLDGVDFEVPIGQFLNAGCDPQDDGVKVTSVDLMKLPAEDPMPWPSSPAAGTRVRRELQRLAGSLPVTLDDGVHDNIVPRTSQWGTSRVENLQSLASAQGFGLRVGADACLHAFPLRDASYVDVLCEEGKTLISVEPPAMAGRIPNRWVATGTVSVESEVKTETKDAKGKVKTSTKKVTKEHKVTAVRTSDVTPYDHASYGWVTEVVSVSSADSDAAVGAAANKAMSEALSSTATRTIHIVPDARIEVGDIVGVVNSSETFAGRVVAYSLPLSDASATERVDLQLLQW